MFSSMKSLVFLNYQMGILGILCVQVNTISIFWAHDNVDIEIQDVNSKRIFQLDRCPTTYNISKKLPKAIC
jgi:hypothetical protein